MKILIADRSPQIVDRLAKLLNEICGIGPIAHAFDAVGVMSSLDLHRPEVAIIDPHIANSGGMQFLKRIKDRQPGVVLIVISNLFCRTHGRLCLEAGADYFLDKSNEFGRLPVLLRSIQKGFWSLESAEARGNFKRSIKKNESEP